MRSLSVDVSPARRARLKDFYSRWQDAPAKVSFDTMGLPGQVDYLLLKNSIAYELQQLEIKTKKLAETEAQIPFAKRIADLDVALHRMEEVDSAKAAGLLNEMNKQIKRVREAIEAGLVPCSGGCTVAPGLFSRSASIWE